MPTESKIYTYYAIRHIPTGWLMPAYSKKIGKAFTKTEPMDPMTHAPRLFTNKRAAFNALSWWIRGWAHPKVRFGYTFEGQEDAQFWIESEMPDIRGELGMVPRHKADFEVIEMSLCF